VVTTLRGDDALVEHAAGVVHVVEEALQGLHALLDAGLDPCPLLHLDHAREDVERGTPAPRRRCRR
jgi:hypothetical protein